MEKEHVLEHLRLAKTAHIKWVQKAKLLINGLDVKQDAIPVDTTECEFGKWFYSDGQVLNGLANDSQNAMAKIEKLHFKLHDIYLQIFNLYFNKPQIGFFTNLFGNKKKNLDSVKIVTAKDYYTALELVSRDLLQEINKLEKNIIAVSEDEMKELI